MDGDSDYDLFVQDGREADFFKERPDLSHRQQNLLNLYYDLKRECKPVERVPADKIEQRLGILQYEPDCAKVIIQSIDDHYIDIYVKRIKNTKGATP